LDDLALAVGSGDIGAVKVILFQSRDGKGRMDNRDAAGYTVLHVAAFRGHGAMVKLLLEAGASMETRTADESRLLRGATKHESGYTAGPIQLLLESGIAKHQAMDASGDTALHCTAEFGGVEAARVLLTAGAERDARNRKNKTPLHRAVQHKSVQVVRLLLDAGADANARDKRHSTPLLGALKYRPCENSAEIARALLAAGADPSCRDRESVTPLQLAATGRDVAMVRALLEAGADTEAKDANQETVLFSAIGAGGEGDVAMVRALLEAGADTEAKDANQQTVLFSAIRARGHGVVRVLLEGGADAEARCMKGTTPLMRAAFEGDPLGLELLLLLGKGAAVDARDRHDKTALHWALSFGLDNDEQFPDEQFPEGEVEMRLEVVKLLVAKGADVEARDMDDNTPLLAAVEYGGFWQVYLKPRID